MVTGRASEPDDAPGDPGLAGQVSNLQLECERLRIRHEDLSRRIVALEGERALLQRQLVERESRSTPDGARGELLDQLADASVSEQAVRKRLAEALETIAHMQRSRFWKARTLTASVRDLFR